MQVPFIDLTAAYESQKSAIDSAMKRVLASGWYILGEEVLQFEEEFAGFCNSKWVVGVASGTDALLLALQAHDIGPGDDVITVSHTAVATTASIELSGARPVFIDVDPLTFTLDPARLPETLSPGTKAIIPVHLYGQPANMGEVMAFAKAHNLIVIEDCAQAHGAKYDGRPAGSIGHAAAYSFYPTKNLGAVGDGGAIVCQDESLAKRLRELRQYGWRLRYISEEVGNNSRLDELQAAILRVKLGKLARDNEARRQAARQYNQMLQNTPLQLPQERPGYDHVYHLYVVQAPERDALRTFLTQREIATAVHYPVPVHLQPAYTRHGYERGSLPVTEQLADYILSLPMFPQISEAQVTVVAEAIRNFYTVT